MRNHVSQTSDLSASWGGGRVGVRTLDLGSPLIWRVLLRPIRFLSEEPEECWMISPSLP